MDKLIKKVEKWGDSKGITGGDNFFNQWQKVNEEFGELTAEIDFFKEGHGDLNSFKMELGDLLVTLIVITKASDTSIKECLELAYNKISKRKGETINGIFVKESDL